MRRTELSRILAEWTPEMEAMYEALKREPEPEAHCYECPNRHDECAEYASCNRPNAPYDRGHCHWGYETIQKAKHKEDIQ